MIFRNLKPEGIYTAVVFSSLLIFVSCQLLNAGVVSGDLMLSDQTVLGEWKIEVKAAVSFVFVATINKLSFCSQHLFIVLCMTVGASVISIL